MALIECPECNKQISKEAEACPSCGHPMKKRRPVIVERESSGRTSGCAWIALLAIVMAVIASVFSDDERPLPTAEELDQAARKDAIYTCEQFAKKRMLDPDAAQFDRQPAERVMVEGDAFTLLLVGRGKNAFGGYVPARFRCQLHRTGKDWTLIQMTDLKSGL